MLVAPVASAGVAKIACNCKLKNSAIGYGRPTQAAVSRAHCHMIACLLSVGCLSFTTSCHGSHVHERHAGTPTPAFGSQRQLSFRIEAARRNCLCLNYIIFYLSSPVVCHLLRRHLFFPCSYGTSSVPLHLLHQLPPSWKFGACQRTSKVRKPWQRCPPTTDR